VSAGTHRHGELLKSEGRPTPVASKPPRLRWIKGGDRDNAGRATMAPDMLRWRGLELAGTRATHAALDLGSVQKRCRVMSAGDRVASSGTYM